MIKFMIYSIFIVVGLLFVVFMLESKDHKYEIMYDHRCNCADYTDSIIFLPDGKIKYYDEHNRLVIRSGNFQITQQH